MIWNGGFEGDLLNGGFAWRYRPQLGADVNWDDQTRHAGGRSLRIDFDGTANVDFQDFWQYVAVRPETRLRVLHRFWRRQYTIFDIWLCLGSNDGEGNA